MTTAEQEQQAAAAGTTPWRELGIALLLSLAVSAVIGGGLLMALDNIWWGEAAAVASVFAGAFYVARSSGEPEPMHGTMLVAAYFGVAVAVIFAGSAPTPLPGPIPDLQIPDPLPGLELGNSTFFFVSPLLLLAGGVAGSVAGGQRAAGSAARGRSAR